MKIFVTGIGTGVGKTIASAILVEALQADYWKPVQSGNLDFTDTDQVSDLVSNPVTEFHPEAFRLKEPASPHYSAELEGIAIKLADFRLPDTDRNLIVEGAGGVLVPLNQQHLILDLIQFLKIPVVLISRHYLGSINHTLLSIEALKSRKIEIAGLIFNGNENRATEEAILNFGKVNCLGRINEEAVITKSVISSYAEKFKAVLKG